jgi:hypothetical protein
MDDIPEFIEIIPTISDAIVTSRKGHDDQIIETNEDIDVDVELVWGRVGSEKMIE